MKRVLQVALTLLVSQASSAAELVEDSRGPAGQAPSPISHQADQPPTLDQWVPRAYRAISHRTISLYQDAANLLQTVALKYPGQNHRGIRILQSRALNTPKYLGIHRLTRSLMISLNYMRQVTEQMYVPIAALVSGSPSERARLPLSRKIAVIAILQDVSYWENSHHTLLDMLGQIIHTSDILVQIIHTPALVPDPMSHSMHIMLARNKRDIAPPLAWHLIPKCRQNPSLWVDYAIESAEIEQQIKELIPEGMHPFDFAEIRRKQGRPLPVDWIASVTSRTARLADDTRFRKIPQEQKLAMNVLIHFDSLRATILRELVTLRLLTVSGGPRDTPAVEAARIVYRLWAQAHEPQSRDPIMMTPLSPAQVGLARSLMDIFELYPHPTLSEITSVIAGEQQYTQLRRILEAPECRAVPEEFKRWSLILAWSIPPGAPIAFESTTRVSQASFLGPQHSDEEVLAQVAAELGLISPLSLEQQQILRALAVYAPYLLIRFLANQQIFPPPVSIPQTAQARPEQSTMLPHPI